MELITNNYLDRGFQNMLLPFRCLNHLVFISRFSIEYNCIRPHSRSYYIISFMGVLCYIIFHSLKFFDANLTAIPNQFIQFFLKVNIIMLLIPYAGFFILNVLHRNKHVQILLKMQKAFRIINYKRYKLAILWNWFGVFRHIGGFIITTAYIRLLSVAEYFYTLIFFDVHITYAISLITLIRDGVITWIAELERHSQNLEVDKDKHDERMKKLFQAYINLMEAYEIFKKLFQVAVRILSF
ncbi:hypothetical protein B5X24_HaOG200729 [Helicoverpa armigera]|uniref:Gustatory receptor n=1 Tax=Helicoverpa armigera TaxID=29058 RepID=A0A2W1BPU8_HELAM|nr:hypothetical protein B5X24_HaOG200729 [Helicoverpa armigera]